MSKCSNVRSPGDIPLRESVIAARGTSPNSYPKVVKVFQIPLEDSDILKFEYTCGADDAAFRAATDKARLQIIFEAKWTLIVVYKMPEHLVHEALLVIPDYRRKMRRLNGRRWPRSTDKLT